jgi:polysaccharide deacetylase family protein (PEP-CTERM system associated)
MAKMPDSLQATRVPLSETDPGPAEPTRQHVLTVAVEDYYQVGAFNRLIQQGKWHRFESRVEAGTGRTLDLLREHDVTATFFVLGWIAQEMPELVRRIAEEGHEVASKGFYHRSIRQMSPEEFREDLSRSREVIEAASGRPVHGYRVADEWFEHQDLWALDVLAQEGYRYDSSIAPIGPLYRRQPWRRFVHPHAVGDRSIWEFPISAASILGWGLPIAGGNWFRQLPARFIRWQVSSWNKRYDAPLVMYFHTWELDPDQPRITAAPWIQRVRQYRNLSRMSHRLRWFLERLRFRSVADHLGVALEPVQARVPEAASLRVQLPEPDPSHTRPARERATVVVPCYNEELILPYLARTLANMKTQLEGRFELEFILVDDGSRDGTWNLLQRLFGSLPDHRVLRHVRNQGVAAAILTGIRNATTNVVCSIDCDCTYDPLILGDMIPLLRPGVDLVTASPYHAEGKVINVPGWRLVLSRTLSLLYRLVLHNQLHTYTSCLRVYRRSSAARLELTRRGFLGIAETLGRIDLAGGRIVEFPATLEVRLVGRSKMKVLGTIVGHLGLLGSLARQQLGRSLRAVLAPSQS